MDLITIERALQPVFAARPEVRLAYLFGSIARERANQLSDIDLALLIDQEQYKKLDAQEPYGYKATLIADLVSGLHEDDVDLVLLHEATPLLAYEVIRAGVPIFCRDEGERIAFEIGVKKRYLDTKPLREIKRHYLYERIERGAFSEVKLPSSIEK